MDRDALEGDADRVNGFLSRSSGCKATTSTNYYCVGAGRAGGR